jgi:hypothetical protein
MRLRCLGHVGPQVFEGLADGRFDGLRMLLVEGQALLDGRGQFVEGTTDASAVSMGWLNLMGISILLK